MKTARHLVTALSVVVWLWAMASVVGIFFNPVRTAFWSSSLIWALFATLLLTPALVLLYDENVVGGRSDRSELSRHGHRADQKAKSGGNAETEAPSSSLSDKRSFIESAEAAYPVGTEHRERAADRDDAQSEGRSSDAAE